MNNTITLKIKKTVKTVKGK